ncbi:MAG: extracellular solute-binding protein [Clostridia bacterium]|nr:extracellular solute-binding protein [Clostridia bacterium]
MLKRILTLLLALIMCSAALFGCSKNKPEETGDSSTVTTNESSDDGIGDYDFGGADFTILARKETNYEHVGSMGSDVVTQKVYERNEAVKSRFNVNLNVVELDGSYDKRDQMITAMRAENMSPTGAYDLVSTHSVYLGWMGMEGLTYDMTTLPEIDFSKSYWNQNLYNELNVDGSCYMMIGDIGHTLYEYITVMFVNTKVLENNKVVENGIDGLYEIVENNEWTWEKCYQLAENIGDGETSYGLLMNVHAMRASLIAQDLHVFTRNAETERFYMEPSANEHTIKAVENLSKFFARPNMYFADVGTSWGCAEDELNPIFAADSALFYPQMLGQAMNLQERMGTGYSIVPLPKYDAFQTDYYTICRDTVTGVAVLSCVKNPEMSGVITQALCMYGAELVTPEYYEKALKYRYNNDPKSIEMLDKIRDSLTVEAVPTYFDTGIDADIFYPIISSGQQEGVASIWEGQQAQGNNLINLFYEKIDALKAG